MKNLIKRWFELDLSQNRIETISPQDFCGLQKLIKLDLSQNLLKSINEVAFEEINSIEKFKMDGKKSKINWKWSNLIKKSKSI